MGGRGSSSGKSSKKQAESLVPSQDGDRTYEIDRKFEAVSRKSGIKLAIRGKSEGFRAIYESPEGTRFKVNYTFGGSDFYEINIRGGGQKEVQPINEQGRHDGRSRTIRNVSAVKSLFSNARSITILGGSGNGKR